MMNDGYQRVIECYVKIVTTGKMELEEVPERYRDKVEEMLNGESNHDK